jgi:hypothetical protein
LRTGPIFKSFCTFQGFPTHWLYAQNVKTFQNGLQRLLFVNLKLKFFIFIVFLSLFSLRKWKGLSRKCDHVDPNMHFVHTIQSRQNLTGFFGIPKFKVLNKIIWSKEHLNWFIQHHSLLKQSTRKDLKHFLFCYSKRFIFWTKKNL